MEQNRNQESERLPDEPVAEEKPHYEPRPRWQLVWAWILVAIVAAGFLGYCYWIANS